jgi:hypothetical protein
LTVSESATSPEGITESPKTHANGRRIFLGFGAGEIDRLLRDFSGRVLDAPRVSAVDDAWMSPLVRTVKGHFTGGVCDRSGYLPELSLHRGFRDKRQAHISAADDRPAYATRCETFAEAWFGGYLFDHYGHFLLEGLARILTPQLAASDAPIVFFNPMRMSKLPSYVINIFSLIGIDHRRIILCNSAMRIERLHVQEPAFEINGVVRPEPYQRIKLPHFTENPSEFSYVSRSKLGRKRVVRKEEVLEALLTKEFGARIVYPEDLGFEEQIDTISRSKLLMGCEGSAFHTCIFLRKIPTSMILCNRPPHINYLLCDELFDGDTIYVNAAQRRAGATNSRTDWELDGDLAIKAIPG